jgi:hypothetical protein
MWCDHLICQLHLQRFLFIEVLKLAFICTIRFYEESIPQSIASVCQSPSFNYIWLKLPCFHLHPPMRRPLVISRKSLPTLIMRLLNWHHEFHLIIRLFGLFNIDYNLVQCLGLLFLLCMNQLVFLLAIFMCMRKSLSHLLDCTTLFHLKFGHELHEKNQLKNQLIDNAWSRWVLKVWFN